MNSYLDNLHKNANSYLFTYAKKMRHNPTEAEELLWKRLRRKQVNGLKFRRQHPLNKYIADFYCHEKKLVIEVDGVVHENDEVLTNDAARTKVLETMGIMVLRFRNDEIVKSINKVVEKIIEVTKNLPLK